MTVQSISRIYLNALPESQEISSSDRIGNLWAKIQEEKNPDFKFSLLEKLGVAPRDKEAQESSLELIERALHENVEIVASELDTGVYFLSLDGVKFAVFKVGEKRARMELLTRKIAHLIGLEKHAISGVLCSLACPPLPEDEMAVELWNGNIKIFESVSPLSKPYRITGILEPYLDSDEEISSEDFLSMTVYALVIGLRDGKLSGLSGKTLFDLEDCMPERFIPGSSPNKKVAATHLPFLEHRLAQEKIEVAGLRKLAKRVSELFQHRFSFRSELERETIDVADLASERREPLEEVFDDDDGSCSVMIDAPKKIMESHAVHLIQNLDQPLLNESQLNACIERITRLHTILDDQIRRNAPISTIDLVCAVDPFYGEHIKALRNVKYDRMKVTEVVGRFTPSGSSPLTEEQTQVVVGFASPKCRRLFV